MNRPRRRPVLRSRGSAAERRLLRTLRALGEGTRLGILRFLATRRGPVRVREITARFRLRQPTISHHLKVLREAGLVEAEPRGTEAWYSPRAGALEGAAEALRRIARGRRGA